jgi:FtsH-binding integral membrane protein
MENKPSQPEEKAEKKRPLAFALALAFAPSAMALTLFTISQANIFPTITTFWQHLIGWVCCLLSLFCCVVASLILFQRRKVFVILLGLVLLLLNAFIAFCFGCAATIKF